MPAAIVVFSRTIKRSFRQIRLQKRLSRVTLKRSPTKIPAEELSELTRTALVLGVAALDAYFTNKFVDCLVPYLKKYGPTDGIIEVMEKAGFDTRTALELLPKGSGERPYRKLRTLVDRHLDRHTTQRLDVIDRLFLSMGLKDLCKNASAKAGRKNLCRRIEIAVERRHDVVHEGDLNAHGNLRAIDADDINGRLQDIKLLVEKCDEIINSRIK